MDDAWLNRVLYTLLVIVAYLFYGELRRAWDLRQQALWDDRYIEAVRSSPEEWRFGWRLEDLESRLHVQRRWAEALHGALDARGADDGTAAEHVADGLAAATSDVAAFVTLDCAARPGRVVHVGPDEFRDMSDRCHAFSGLDVDAAPDVGPQAIFEVVHLDGDEGSVGLRALSNGKFARVKAPPAGAEWNAPWIVEFASPLAGLAERFQLKPMAKPAAPEPVVAVEAPKEENAFDAYRDEFPVDDVYGGWDAGADARPALTWGPSMVMLYSELMRGYVQCAGGDVSVGVRGWAGETVDELNADYYFNASKVDAGALRTARRLLAASRHVAATRAAADAARRDAQLADLAKTGLASGLRPGESADPRRRDGAKSAFEASKLKVAVVVPMTSRGTDMNSVDQSPLWFNLFASFVESVDWRKNKHQFVFYLGFDRGDALYDTGDAWQDMRSAFRGHATKALKWLGYGNWTIKHVLDHGPKKGQDPALSITLVHFDDTSGAPSQAVSQMAKRAVFDDGADYVYQLNDDTILVSKDWLETYVRALEASELAPNLGVAGPLDTQNERILTHSFVHRTHVEIFDAFFPKAFRNWWSDDWISTVYGSRATFARRDVVVTHNVQSQKTGAWNRYDVDHAAQHQLHSEVQKGFVVINAWLRDKGFPTMPLPDVCGYSPMMTRIHDTLMRHGL